MNHIAHLPNCIFLCLFAIGTFTLESRYCFSCFASSRLYAMNQQGKIIASPTWYGGVTIIMVDCQALFFRLRFTEYNHGLSQHFRFNKAIITTTTNSR